MSCAGCTGPNDKLMEQSSAIAAFKELPGRSHVNGAVATGKKSTTARSNVYRPDISYPSARLEVRPMETPEVVANRSAPEESPETLVR
jgi:hypothetical protein